MSLSHSSSAGDSLPTRPSLRNSDESLLEKSISSVHTGVLITDATLDDNPIVFVNDGFLAMTGYTEREVLGRNCRFLQGERTSPEAVHKMREAVHRETPCKVLIENYRKDGSAFWNEVQITPLSNELGRVTNFVGIQQDVSERQAKEQALCQAYEDAQRANSAKSRFLANVSHEIRSPLAAMLGVTDMLAEKLGSHEEVATLLEILRRNGDQLRHMLFDLLDLSAIETGQLRLSVSRIPLAPWIRELRDALGVRARESNCQLRFIYPHGLPSAIHTDGDRLRQAMINLMTSVMDFAIGGAVELEIIQPSNPPEQSALEFRIRISGPNGPVHIPRPLFAMLSQDSRYGWGRKDESTLGINVSRHLLTSLDGKFLAIEQGDRIIELAIRLPMMPVEKAPAESWDSSYLPRANVIGEQARDMPRDARILIVDDSRDIRLIASHFLTKSGCRVATATDGMEALDLIDKYHQSSNAFELILLDLHMPRLDGADTLAELRRRDIHVPVVALTADVMHGTRRRLMEDGFDEYVEKPIDATQLRAIVARALRRYRESPQ